MDKDRLKIHHQTDSREQGDKEGYVEAPGTEIPEASIRRSSRLLSKKRESFSPDAFRSFHRSSKYTIHHLKASPDRKDPVSVRENGEDIKHQLPHNKKNNGVLSADTASMKSSTSVPSFSYHVESKNGIQLVVDLNLSQYDWLRSMEKSVCVCQNHQKPEFKSFREEIEYLGNRNNPKVSLFDKSIASDASLNSCVQNDFSLKSSREIEKTLTSVVEKEVTPVSSLEFCPKDGYTKSLSSNGLKGRQSKNNQSSELVRESYGNATMQENCSRNAECLESFSSEELQSSDFSIHQKGSSCSRTGKIGSASLLTSTTEGNQETDGNHRPSIVDSRGRVNSAEGMEVSVREENGLVTSSSEDGPKRKKRNCKSNHIYGQCDERILRSTKLFGGQFSECDGLIIRRSSRLLSK